MKSLELKVSDKSSLGECLQAYDKIITVMNKALDHKEIYYCAVCDYFSTAYSLGCCDNRRRIQHVRVNSGHANKIDTRALLSFIAEHDY